MYWVIHSCCHVLIWLYNQMENTLATIVCKGPWVGKASLQNTTKVLAHEVTFCCCQMHVLE